MLLVGRNIQAAADPLRQIEVDYLYKSLQHPQPEVESRIRQLRIVRQTDARLYSRLKKTLPYFVCGVFNPNVRKTENFAYIEYFTIDIDNIHEKQMDLSSIRNWSETDPRVVLSFLSPSEDGLKLMFRLKERCYDAGLYKVFYREFVRRFSQLYGLEQVVDTCTCDVSRACFISIDPNAYYNPSAEPVDLNQYLPTADPSSLFDMKHQQEKEAASQPAKPAPEPVSGPAEPDSDVLDNIRQTLQLKRQKQDKVPRNPIYVPERLESIMVQLKGFVEDQGVTVYDVTSIQYGKKIRCKLDERLAEVNLFYGKRGFSVVQSPKSNVSAKLNEVVAEIIQIFLDENT